ncbi:MAG: hypothetical protein F2681_10160 [Actinobacteria bacterium]|nr:hypothetical protein [Actinomycetota bacterium]MSZ83493.1 hypothetical protein [Actinomycetota bacterium]MTB18496.1 hypothetical protein [Actinomycetota bacterium]
MSDPEHAVAVQRAISHWRTAKDYSELIFRTITLVWAFELLAEENPGTAGMNPDVARRRLIESIPGVLFATSVRQLVDARPLIRDLGRNGPNSNPEAGHKKAVEAFGRLDRSGSPRNVNDAADRLADLLWIVRSNLAHGHKAALPLNSPLPFPLPRDQSLAGLAAAVLEECLELTLGPLSQADRLPRPRPEPPIRRLP